ncbi:hypothetical protein TURU_046655 [Turdus rufiventris]|nr:hypothetical protein TURU_046655 [Turdus rufiventris]
MKPAVLEVMRMNRVCRMVLVTSVGSFILVIFYFQSMLHPDLYCSPLDANEGWISQSMCLKTVLDTSVQTPKADLDLYATKYIMHKLMITAPILDLSHDGQITEPLGDLADCKAEYGPGLKYILKMWKNIKKY